jgi:hypothetical protein
MYERRYTILLAKTRTTIGRLDAIAGGRSEVPDYEKFTVAWPTTAAVERRPPNGEVDFLHSDRRGLWLTGRHARFSIQAHTHYRDFV